MQANKEVEQDTYRFFVPIEDQDLLKSVTTDANGDYIVQGVMTSDDTDEEDDSINPEGMDCSYFLEKGWIKYEHGNAPAQFIGEPLEVKVGRFPHPTLRKSVNGIFVKGRLFAQRELAKQAVDMLQDLQKSNTKRRMGWSIEGNVQERDRNSGKIIKSILRNVVLTLNPVNTLTWAELSKSFAKNHEIIIDMGDIEKAMDIGATTAITPQSLEGSNPKDDCTPVDADDGSQAKFIKMFRDFVKGCIINKSLQDKFVASPPDTVGMTAYMYAVDRGVDNEDAYEFASYITSRHEILKSLFGTNFGGETMSMAKIASLLDADLEELRKSLNEEDDDQDDGNNNDDQDDENNNDDQDDDDQDDEETEKSLKTDFAKSLAAEGNNAAAFEVSDFLLNVTEEIGFHMDGFAKSMAHMTKQNNVLVKALTSVCETVQSLSNKVEDLQSENDELKKSLDDVLDMPLARRSVVSNREVKTLQKSHAGDKLMLNRAQISDVLMKSFEAGEIPGTAVSRFEAGVSINNLDLPKNVIEKLGM